MALERKKNRIIFPKEWNKNLNLSRRVIGLAALSFFMVMSIAYITFNGNDASWNTTYSGQKMHNFFGLAGSYACDAFIQLFGVGTFVIILYGIVGSFYFLTNKKIDSLPIKIFYLALGILLVSLPFNLIPVKSLDGIHFGGALSFALYHSLSKAIPLFGYGFVLYLVHFMAGLLGLALLLLTAGLRLHDIKDRFTLLYTQGSRIPMQSIFPRTLVFWNNIQCRFFSGKDSHVDRVNSGEEETQEDSSHDVPSKTVGSINLSAMSTDSIEKKAIQGPSMNQEYLAITTQPSAGKESINKFKVTPSYQQTNAPDKGTNSSRPLKSSQPHHLPSIELLDLPKQKNETNVKPEHLEERAVLLQSVLEEFGVSGDIVNIRPGPVVTLYEFKPAPGIKTSRVIGLSDDIARSMSSLSARIATIPGRNVIGIELPNTNREIVFLRDLLSSTEYQNNPGHLPLIVGKDIGGQPIIVDLAKMPHLLVAGTTGSGKSVSINTMILSLLFRHSPETCKFIMIDPKMLELSVYDDIPHLLTPVVTNPKKAVVALKWAVKEMENRYRLMSKIGVRNIDGYNARLWEAKQSGEILQRRIQTGFDPDTGKPIFENQTYNLEELPFIVVVVDEMADLMMVAGKEIEAGVQRLAQMARAAGIHVIMATQRPSVDVITGTIKANFPTRMSFQVTSKIDSRTILGEQGAEQLLGQGDMLYMAGGGRLMRVHAPFVRDDEVERIVNFLKDQGAPQYIENLTEDDELSTSQGGDGEKDELYQQALDVIQREKKASTSFIQRSLRIGYNTAARIIDQMEKDGVVSPANHVGKREILI